MTSYLIDISGHALIEAEAIKLVHLRRNQTPFRCPETGRPHFAHIAIETWHDVYKVPFETVPDARAAFTEIVECIRTHRRSAARDAAARRHTSAPSGRLAERESEGASVREAAE